MDDDFIRPLWPARSTSTHGILPTVSLDPEVVRTPIHQAMQTLEWMGIARKVCSLDCPMCNVSMGCFEDPDDVPDTVDCPRCDMSFDAYDLSAEVVYLLRQCAEG